LNINKNYVQKRFFFTFFPELEIAGTKGKIFSTFWQLQKVGVKKN
jgi:hypothetical protein